MPDPQQGAPQTLPPDFFSKGTSQGGDTLPPDFFDKQKAAPAQAPPDPEAQRQQYLSTRPITRTLSNIGSGFMKGIAGTDDPNDIHPLDGLYHIFSHPVDSLQLIVGGLKQAQAQGMQTADKTVMTSGAAPNQYQKAGQAMTGFAEEAAAHIPVLGPMAVSAIEASRTGHKAEALGTAAALGLGKALPESAKGVGEKASDVSTALTKEANRPGSPTNMALQAHKIMDNMATDQQANLIQAVAKASQENGAKFHDIAIADKASSPHQPTHSLAPLYNDIMQSTGTARPSATGPVGPMAGIVDKLNALNDPARLDSTTGQPAGSKIWFDQLKDLRTDIGRAAQSARSSGNARDAFILDSSYKTATGMLAKTADRLGMADKFTDANSEFEQLFGHKENALKPLFDISMRNDAGAGSNFIAAAKNTINTPQWHNASNFLSKYGYDTNSLPEMLETTNNIWDKTNKFEKGLPSGMVGKMRALGEHPLAAGPVGAALYSIPGIPSGMKFLTTMMAMGKTAGLLDKIELAGEIRKLGMPTEEATQVLQSKLANSMGAAGGPDQMGLPPKSPDQSLPQGGATEGGNEPPQGGQGSGPQQLPPGSTSGNGAQPQQQAGPVGVPQASEIAGHMGVKFVGKQPSYGAKGMSDMYVLQDPQTKTTFTVPIDNFSTQTVQQALVNARMKFAGAAIPEAAPVNPQEVADLKAKNPGRVVTPEKVSALNREEAASEVTSGKANLPKETEVANIREPHRAKLEKPDPNRYSKTSSIADDLLNKAEVKPRMSTLEEQRELAQSLFGKPYYALSTKQMNVVLETLRKRK